MLSEGGGQSSAQIGDEFPFHSKWPDRDTDRYRLTINNYSHTISLSRSEGRQHESTPLRRVRVLDSGSGSTSDRTRTSSRQQSCCFIRIPCTLCHSTSRSVLDDVHVHTL